MAAQAEPTLSPEMGTTIIDPNSYAEWNGLLDTFDWLREKMPVAKVVTEDGSIDPTSVTAKVTRDRDGEPVWDPEGKSEVFPAKGSTMARINWKDRINAFVRLQHLVPDGIPHTN